MSIRTVLELNHDMAGEIRRDPEGFVAALLEQVRSANNPETASRLRLYGVHVIESVHHSAPRALVIDGREVRFG